jgi:hypothetical protein
MEEVIHQDYIYEFDLRGFFDNVDLELISDQLKRHVPIETLDYLMTINQSRPKITEALLPESSLDRTRLDELKAEKYSEARQTKRHMDELIG